MEKEEGGIKMRSKKEASKCIFRPELEEIWQETLRNFPSEFFTSDEAHMRIRSKFKPGQVGFGNFPLNEGNNNDVHPFWENEVEQEVLQERVPSQWDA